MAGVEQRMSPDHVDALKKNAVLIVKDLLIEGLFLTHLQSQDILTRNMVETIQAIVTTSDKNKKFLDILPKRGPMAFDVFLTALEDTKQRHIAEALKKSLIPSPLSSLKECSSIMFEWVRGVCYLPNGDIGYCTSSLQLGTAGVDGTAPACSLRDFSSMEAWHLSSWVTEESTRLLVASSSQVESNVHIFKVTNDGKAEKGGNLRIQNGTPCHVAMGADNSAYILKYMDSGSFFLCKWTDEDLKWEQEIKSEDVIDVTVDSKGTCHVLVPEKIYTFDPRGLQGSTISIGNRGDDCEKAFCIDEAVGDFIIAYSSGILRLFTSEGELRRELMTCPSSPTSVTLSRKHGLVVGTEDGIYHYELHDNKS